MRVADDDWFQSLPVGCLAPWVFLTEEVGWLGARIICSIMLIVLAQAEEPLLDDNNELRAKLWTREQKKAK